MFLLVLVALSRNMAWPWPDDASTDVAVRARSSSVSGMKLCGQCFWDQFAHQRYKQSTSRQSGQLSQGCYERPFGNSTLNLVALFVPMMVCA